MDENFGSDFLTLTDEEGQSFELELIDSIEYDGNTYTIFLPVDMSEDDPEYGFVILQNAEEDGEEVYDTINDDELLETLYNTFMEVLYKDEEDSDN